MLTAYPHQVDASKSTFCGLPAGVRLRDYPAMTGTSELKEYAAIGERLRRVREAFSDLHQKAWAEKHGFNQTQYNNWEGGSRRIPVDSAERLVDLYGLSLDFIYRGRRDGLSEKASKLV